MSKLVRAYENPDGMLNPDEPVDFGERLLTAINNTRTGAPIELSNELITSLGRIEGKDAQSGADGHDGDDGDQDAQDEQAGSQTVAGSRIDVAAVVKVHHICGGWDNRIDEEQNGSADLTLTFDQAGLIPTVWGELTNCRFERGDVEAELDGKIRIRFGTDQPRVRLQALRSVGQFVDFDGSVKATRGTEKIELELSSNFRFFLNGDVHVNVNLADGTNVIGIIKAEELMAVASTHKMELGVITREAQWTCRVDAVDKSGQCSEADDPEAMVVQW